MVQKFMLTTLGLALFIGIFTGWLLQILVLGFGAVVLLVVYTILRFRRADSMIGREIRLERSTYDNS